jgi:excisionase family DNA binding protein
MTTSYSVAEVGEMLGVSEVTIRRMLQNHTLPYFKVGPTGATIRIQKSDLDEYIEKQRGETKDV